VARYDDLNTNSIAYAVVVSSLVLLVAVLGMQALSYSLESYEQSRKMQTTEYTRAKRTLSEQAASLSGYYLEQTFESEGADRPEELVGERIQIPIDRAKELILKELGTSGGA
jgi:Tfp pilus assembly protein PilV